MTLREQFAELRRVWIEEIITPVAERALRLVHRSVHPRRRP